MPGLICAVIRLAPNVLNRAASRCLTRLYRRTRHRSVGAEHAAIARLGAQEFAAARTFVEILARIGRHGLGLRRTAGRAGDRGIRDHSRFLNAKAWSRYRMPRSDRRKSFA